MGYALARRFWRCGYTREAGAAPIKQLRRDGGRVFLHSLNPAYADLEISDALPLRVLGKAVS